MMKNRILSAFLSFIAIAVTGLQTASAIDVVIGDITYDVGTTTVTVKACDTSAEGDLVLLATVDEKPVTSIGDDAFADCESLTTITIPASVTSIGEGAFAYCLSLSSISIPAGVTAIKDRTFCECENLMNVTIPDGVTSIGTRAFYYCAALTTLALPDGLLTISDYAFEECESLTSINIPASLTVIGEAPFYGCCDLVSINTDPASLNFASVNGVLFTKNLETLIKYPAAKNGPYFVPNGTISIGSYAFDYSLNLATITFPNSLTTLEDYALYDARALINLILPDSVTSIGKGSCSSCDKLRDVVIGSGLASIGDQAFSENKELRNFDVDGTNTNYASFNRILFSKDLTTLVSYPGARIGPYTIPSSTTTIGKYAFEGLSKIPRITIPDSVTSIETSAFEGCSSLGSLFIPDSVLSIGENSFRGCSNLTSVVVGNGVMSIGSDAFSACPKLKCVQLRGNAPTLGNTSTFPTSVSGFTFKARVGGTGFGAGLYAQAGVQFKLDILSLAYDLDGNLVIWTDALNSDGLELYYSADILSGFTQVAGVTSTGDNGLMIPSTNVEAQGSRGFFRVKYDEAN